MNDICYDANAVSSYNSSHSLQHHGVRGQKWGVRRYQNEDGSLTPEGKERYTDMMKAVYVAASSKDAKDKGPLKTIDEYKKRRNSKYGRKQSRFGDWMDAWYDASLHNDLIKDYDESIQTLTYYTGSKEKSIKMVDDFLDDKKQLTLGEILKDYH